MLMPLPDLAKKHGLDLAGGGVLHLGAHLAEEAPVYAEMQVGDVWWVEANKAVLIKIARVLEQFPGQRLLHALLWEKDDETKTLNVTNYDGMSSSILPFGTHPQFSPDTKFVGTQTMPTRTVDTLVATHNIQARMLTMDLQGVEGFVLRGAQQLLADPHLRYVMSEVNNAEVYVGCTKVDDLDRALAAHEFARVDTYWVPGQGWGDALWIRK